MSLKSLLVSVADRTLSKTGQSILSGLGMGIVSSAVVLTLFMQLVSYAQNNWSSMPNKVLMILALANIHYALSIIVGACILRIKLQSAKVSFGRIGK